MSLVNGDISQKTFMAFQVTINRNQEALSVININTEFELKTVAYANQLMMLKYSFTILSVVVLYLYWKTVILRSDHAIFRLGTSRVRT